MKKHEISVRMTKDTPESKFVVDNWPETVQEAMKIWGEKAVMFCVNGTSAIVQVQNRYRNLRTREKNAMTHTAASVELSTWKPSDGDKIRLDRVAKVTRVAKGMSEEDRKAVIKFLEEEGRRTAQSQGPAAHAARKTA